jgi:nucleotide-binding universal stress UspA family protein
VNSATGLLTGLLPSREGEYPIRGRARLGSVITAAGIEPNPLTARPQAWQYVRKTPATGNSVMYKKILVPIDLADPDLAKPAVSAALMMAAPTEGIIRFINVLPLTPVMLAEYVPPDFEVQQRKAAEDALAIIVKETGLPSSRVSSTVRQGGVYQEVLEEANAMQPDLIVMSSHRPHRHAVRTYFLGSNAGHVVRYAKCSVLVVRN